MWVLVPPAEGGQEEGDNVGGLEAAAAALEAREKFAEGHLVIEGRLFFQWEEPGVLHDGDEEHTPSALDRFNEPLKLNILRPQALGLGADGVVGVGGDAVVVGGERNRHMLECQAVAVLCFVFGIGEQDVGEVDRAAGDVDGLEGVDKRLVEPLDTVVVRRADDGGEGGLRLREEVLGNLGSCHVSTAVVSSQRRERRERRGGSAAESAGIVRWRAWLRGCGGLKISQYYRSAS